jgi:hypothetical protein
MSVCVSWALPQALASDIILPLRSIRVGPYFELSTALEEKRRGYFVPNDGFARSVGRDFRPGLSGVILDHVSRCPAHYPVPVGSSLSAVLASIA